MFESLQDMLTLSDPGRDPKLTLAYGTLLTMILRAETTRRAADDFLGESLSHMLSYLKSPKDMDKVLGALCEGTSKLLCLEHCLRLFEVTSSHCSHCSLGQAVLSSCNVHDVIESRSLHSLRGIAPGHRRDSL